MVNHATVLKPRDEAFWPSSSWCFEARGALWIGQITHLLAASLLLINEHVSDNPAFSNLGLNMTQNE